jgi:hypothetical protein
MTKNTASGFKNGAETLSTMTLSITAISMTQLQHTDTQNTIIPLIKAQHNSLKGETLFNINVLLNVTIMTLG